MFEQSLYETEPVYKAEPVATPLENGDLFHTYELKNWEFTPRIYKILGIATAFNLLALLIFSQTSVLTAKGCDSPLVGRVCDVLDTVYVGSLLFGTEREYVDEAYEKTNLADLDITYVDVSGETPPLSYPEGYFQIANPNEYQAMLDQANNPAPPIDMSGFPSGITTRPSMGNSLIDTKPNIPKSNPNVIDGNLPTIDDRTGLPDTTITRPKRPGMGRFTPPRTNATTPKSTPDPNVSATDPKIKAGPTATPQPTPAAKDESEADKFGVFINKRPLKDTAKDTVAKIDANQVKLDSKFKVVISAVLGLAKDGKTVILKNPKPIPPDKGISNDPAMEKLVQNWILAVGDAGWFGYIERLDDSKKIKAKKVLVTVEQNDTDFYAVIKTEQPDENAAKTLSSGLNALLGLAAPAVSGDEQLFIKSATSTSEGNSLILNVHIPKPQVQEMIQRKLAEQNADPKQPNGNAITKVTNNTTK